MALATGRKARNLREMRDHLLTVSLGSIYHHFWGGLLLPRFEHREFNNDFASWARHGLHEDKLAEKLAVIDPTEFADLERLRQEIVDVIEQRLDESEYIPWAKRNMEFEFIHSKIVVFDTYQRIERPEQLPGAVRKLSGSSIFFHFIDSRRRPPAGQDDFSAWLTSCGAGYAGLCGSLKNIDPYFTSLIHIREMLSRTMAEYFSGRERL
ncbi:MAG: hypothetical protein HY751_02700 [Nitrospinae bacterium]|nr:hypothetical protein [Nitrospinota bacterium]